MADDGRRGYEPKAGEGCGLLLIIAVLGGILIGRLIKRYVW